MAAVFPLAGAHEQPAHWSGVFAMTLCVFALIASEFMPVSLLTPIAVDLHVSEGLVGQGIAISGAFAVLTSLSIAKLAGALNRKTLLLALTGLMARIGDGDCRTTGQLFGRAHGLARRLLLPGTGRGDCLYMAMDQPAEHAGG